MSNPIAASAMKSMREIIEALDATVDASTLAEALDLTGHGEPGVALELLCTQIYEFGTVIPATVKTQIEAVGSAMGISPEYWRTLSSKP